MLSRVRLASILQDMRLEICCVRCLSGPVGATGIYRPVQLRDGMGSVFTIMK
jgi:hypothetical protein